MVTADLLRARPAGATRCLDAAGGLHMNTCEMMYS